jgi:hypothetical protein
MGTSSAYGGGDSSRYGDASAGGVQYCDEHLSRRELAATCSKCVTTTGPMQTAHGYSVTSLNQPAQVHFLGQQSNAATVQSENAALQVEVPGQTITTALPAKKVVVEVPERQVQVQVPARKIQLENAPEVQVTTRPIIKSVEAQLQQAQLKEGIANMNAQSRSGIPSTASNTDYSDRTVDRTA